MIFLHILAVSAVAVFVTPFIVTEAFTVFLGAVWTLAITTRIYGIYIITGIFREGKRILHYYLIDCFRSIDIIRFIVTRIAETGLNKYYFT